MPASEAALSTIANAKPLYYTTFDLHKKRISGHFVDNSTLKTSQVWNINLGDNKEITSIKTQYNQQSIASVQQHFLPTDYGQTGELLYKYLDQNMFAVVTVEADDPTELTVFIINSVTGRVVHQFTESDVSPSKAHPVSLLFTENYFAISFMRLNLESGLTQQELTVV